MRLARSLVLVFSGFVFVGGCATPRAAPVPAVESSAGVAPSDPGALREETLGGVRAGIAETELVKLLGAPTSKSAPVEEGATGELVSTWSWPNGVEASMTATSATGAATLRMLIASGSSTLQTSKGIRVGSSRQEVDAAYGAAANPAHSTEDFVLVGEMFDGLRIRLVGGKVTSISLGSDGE
jgi:hypothetical protein